MAADAARPLPGALPPNHRATLEDFVREIYARNDPALLDLCDARINTLLGRGGSGRTAATPREHALVDFTEQYVLDAQLVTDEMCAELNRHFTEAELSALTTAIAYLDAKARYANAMGA